MRIPPLSSAFCLHNENISEHNRKVNDVALFIYETTPRNETTLRVFVGSIFALEFHFQSCSTLGGDTYLSHDLLETVASLATSSVYEVVQITSGCAVAPQISQCSWSQNLPLIGSLFYAEQGFTEPWPTVPRSLQFRSCSVQLMCQILRDSSH